MELCVLYEYWPVLLNARHCRDTKEYYGLFWYLHSIINTGLVFPSGVSSPSTWVPLPDLHTATSSPRSRAGWCPRNPVSSPAPGSCLRGKDTSAATRTLPCLCYKALHRADSHVCKGLPQALWMSNRGDEGLLFLAHLACTAACAVAVNHCPSGTALPPLLSWPKSGAPSLAACSSSRAGM